MVYPPIDGEIGDGLLLFYQHYCDHLSVNQSGGEDVPTSLLYVPRQNFRAPKNGMFGFRHFVRNAYVAIDMINVKYKHIQISFTIYIKWYLI